MIHVGDCLDILPTLAEKSVHTCVTSPPYFGLRSYGVGAENGEIGTEPTPDAFVAAMVRVFREVKRVLRDDGTCWLNLGDSYAAAGGHNRDSDNTSSGLANLRASHEGKGGRGAQLLARGVGSTKVPYGLKQKDLIGIPWRVAFALQADGWYLRSDCIWHKSNPMPESVRDRPTKSHEYMFLLSKSPRYYWDAEAVREPACEATLGRNDRGRKRHQNGGGSPESMSGDSKQDFGDRAPTAGRNIRSVWTLPTKSFRGAHFATFPPRLVEPCIKAGTSEMGCCPGCGKPWVRMVERVAAGKSDVFCPKSQGHAGRGTKSSGAHEPGWRKREMASSTTTGWRPGCTCGTERPIPVADLEADPTLIDDFEIEPFPPIPCTVLDPFAGAMTTGVVCQNLGRSFIGIELSPVYAEMGERRLRGEAARLR